MPRAITPAAVKTPMKVAATAAFRKTHQVIAIGASTGGTEAIKEVLVGLPHDSPGVVIVQHMPPGFTASYAARLNQCTSLVVKEAANGDKLLPGHVLLAPGNFHMKLHRSGAEYYVEVFSGTPVNHH